MKTCSIDGCTGKSECRGMCQKHYVRLKRTGTTADPKRPSESERFWTKVSKAADCWEWTSALDVQGYGAFRAADGKTVKAHRFAYSETVGSIPDGMPLDHVCHNRQCVNPKHLRPVTQKQNVENHNGATRVSKSGRRGVYFHAATGSYLVQVKHNGEVHTVGYFRSVSQADEAAIAKRNELHTHNNRDRVEQ